MATVFGNWLPALSQQPGTAKKPREQGQSEGQPSKRPRQTRRGQRGNGQKIPVDNLNNIVSILAALSLQQEDALNRVRLDSSHTFHLEQTGPGAILKALYEAGRSWHEKKGQGGAASGPPNGGVRTDGDGDQGQARSLCPGPNRGQSSRGQAVDEPQQTVRVPTMESPGAKARADRSALGVEQAQQLLQELGTYCKDHIITKFNSVRKMKREPEENEKAVFTIEVALRSPEAHKAQELLSQLANNTVWSLVAAQMRPPSLKRHGLAAVLQKALEAD